MAGSEKRARLVSTRTRFDVFKRDDFTCQYCGRKTPSVVLECDHIVPVAEGGGAEIENLTTACFDCNSGKGAALLTSKQANADLEQRRQLILDREAQLRAYSEALAERLKREDAAYGEAWDYWFDLHGVGTLPRNKAPLPNVLRSYIRKLPLELVKRAMDIAYERHGRSSGSTVTPRYFGGVLKGMLAEVEGRIRICPGCHGKVRLEPTDVTPSGDQTGDWWHARCLDKKNEAGAP